MFKSNKGYARFGSLMVTMALALGLFVLAGNIFDNTARSAKAVRKPLLRRALARTVQKVNCPKGARETTLGCAAAHD